MEMFEENKQYISLANKYRPQKFEDMVGQESISKTLQNALKLGRIAHAYLFYGPRGCGKTTTARILAKALNCTGNGQNKPTAEPCGQCPQCLEIAQSADMDVLELDAASNTQVEKVREAIIDTVALAASRDRFKVFILDEVHMLSASSFNALLKTIEEPPSHVVFILATTEKHKVPATIVSRCQTFRFRPITVEEISTHLLDLAGAENIDLTPAAAKIIAKNAGGAMRDALTLLDRAIAFCGDRIDEKAVGEMLGLTPDDLLKQAIEALVAKNGTQLHTVFETLKEEGFDANAFLKDLKNGLGDLFYFSLGQGEEPFAGAAQIGQQVSSGFLAQLSRKINKIIEEVKFSDNALVSAEVGLFTVMESCLDIDAFVRRLEALERGETPSAAAPRPAPVVKTAGTVEKPAVASELSARQPAAAAAPKTAEAAVRSAAPAKTAVRLDRTEEIIADDEPEEEALSAPLAEPAPKAALTDRQVWDKMLKQFARSPFVYDVMTNCSVSFGPTEWILRFGPGKEFYQIPAQNKLPELEQAACKISGRTIKIKLAGNEEEKPRPADTPAQASAPKPDTRTFYQAPAEAQPVQTGAASRAAVPAGKTASAPAKKEAISEEEPFIKANFEADASASSAADQTPEEVKDILEIIPGELLA